MISYNAIYAYPRPARHQGKATPKAGRAQPILRNVNMTPQLYGIPNCATVKKARAWLEEQQIAYEFINFKTQAPTRDWLSGCLKRVPLETLLNKRGTTWRKLTPEEQAQANTEDGAIALMMAHPSVIKRPVLLLGEQIAVGFDAAHYTALFQAA